MITLLEEELKKYDQTLESSKITILGLAYKKNIHDVRLSSTFPIVEKLKENNSIFEVCDPLIDNFKSPSFTLTSLSEAFENSNAILLVTDHDEFLNLDLGQIKNKMKTPIIIDGRNFFDEKNITSLGFSYRAIGKP